MSAHHTAPDCAPHSAAHPIRDMLHALVSGLVMAAFVTAGFAYLCAL